MKARWSTFFEIGKIGIGLLVAGSIQGGAKQAFATSVGVVSYANATAFFTNVAGLLLRSNLNADLTHIQIYPSNQYTPELHRLLQVTANLYDATTNNPVNGNTDIAYPTIFRPQFQTINQEVYITGYVQETNTNFVARPWHTLNDPNDRPINADDNVYGIPLIVGARKGWPAFNKFALQSIAQVTRKIEIRRADTNSPFTTNQMFIMGVTNQFGVQIWNSSSNALTLGTGQLQPLQVWIMYTNISILSATNACCNNLVPPRISCDAFTTNLAFMGFNPDSFPLLYGSAQRPMTNGQIVLSNSVLSMNPSPHFEPVSPTNRYEDDLSVYMLNWHLTNRTALVLCLSYQGCLVDALSLANLDTDFPISQELNTPLPSPVQAIHDLWSMAPFAGINEGMNYQIQLSAGNPPLEASDWRAFAENPSKQADIDNFADYIYNPYSTPDLSQVTPFNPRRIMVLTATWEVNDPLVRYTKDDFVRTCSVMSVTATDQFNTVSNLLSTLSSSYRPWGGNSLGWQDPTAFDEGVKDPGLRCSDAWNFPTGQVNLAECLGQIHRGTPWQTIYFKSRVAQANTWLYPNGPAYALETHPTNDWNLVRILGPLFNTNSARSGLWINETNVAVWAEVLAGISVVSNACDQGPTCCVPDEIKVYSPQVTNIVDGINRRRNNLPDQQFHSLGDLLSTPELTCRSPWISFGYWHLPDCLLDKDYEAIPAHILPLLRTTPLEPLLVITNQFGFSISSAIGQTVVVEGSGDLRNWTALSTNTLSTGRFYFTDPDVAGRPWRFYRARVLP